MSLEIKTTQAGKGQARIAICDFPQFPHMGITIDGLCDALREAGYGYTRYPSPSALAADHASLKDVDVIAGFGAMPVPAAVIESATRLRGVVSSVSGTEGIDMEAATRSGVIVAHAPTPENVRGMAEAAVMLILNLMYDLDGTRRNMQETGTRPLYLKARAVKGKTIGIVGYGRISATVAKLLQNWDVELLVYSRRGADAGLAPNARAVSIDELMSTSDVVCLLAGLDSSTRGFIDDARLRMMKKTAYLINLSRGSILDQEAITGALVDGRIAGAALDVFEVEPLPVSSPLRRAPNTILTPHHVGHTQEVDESVHRAVIANVFALLEGRVPPMVKNAAVVPAWLERWGGRSLGVRS
jgi:phosphoglycerate dehydrogenase-like enzyme